MSFWKRIDALEPRVEFVVRRLGWEFMGLILIAIGIAFAAHDTRDLLIAVVYGAMWLVLLLSYEVEDLLKGQQDADHK